jgi:hypothetical protein
MRWPTLVDGRVSCTLDGLVSAENSRLRRRPPNTIVERFRTMMQSPRTPLLLAFGLALSACSSPADDGDGDAPPFTGFVPPTGSAGTGGAGGQPIPGSNNAGAGNGGVLPAGQAGTTGLGGSPNTPPSAGAGGTGNPAAGGAPAAAGSAGSSMVGAGGTGMELPPETGGSACGGATLFCENFDTLALGPLQGVVNGLRPESTVSIVAEAGRGQVLQVQAGPTYDNKAGVFLDDFATPDNNHYGRMFVRVAQFPDAAFDHWVIVEATGAGSAENTRPVGGQNQRWAPGADGPSAGDWTDWQQSNAATVAGVWTCVEWQMNGAGGGNDILLWVDDQEVRPMDRGNFSFPTIDSLWFGWVVYQNGSPAQYDVRLDDIVLSTERVGCD